MFLIIKLKSNEQIFQNYLSTKMNYKILINNYYEELAKLEPHTSNLIPLRKVITEYLK